MTLSRPTRIVAALGVVLVVLLWIEVPALAYGRPAAAVPAVPPPPAVVSACPSSAAPTPTPTQIRRMHRLAERAAAAGERGGAGWAPTVPEGSAFTVIGLGLVASGGIVFGVGLGGLIQVVGEYNGLVTAAVGPLISVGLGLTLLITGVAFLVHGVRVLKAARAAELARLWSAPPRPAPPAGAFGTRGAPGLSPSHQLVAVPAAPVIDVRF